MDSGALPRDAEADLRLPDFLIIGAMKCGTTSLHRYLGSHPDVFTTAKKEVDYFSRSWRSPETLAEYASHFEAADGAEVAGESSTNYMKEHQFPGTAERIAERLPDAKLICVLRDPVDRVLSHYQHNVWRGREGLPFAEAVERNDNYLATSRYAWQLSHYLARYDRGQVLVLTADELEARPAETVARALRLLGVAEAPEIDTSRRYNVTSRHNRKHRVKFKRGHGLRVRRKRQGLTSYQAVELTDEMRARLTDELRDDVLELRGLLGDDFHCWGVR